MPCSPVDNTEKRAANILHPEDGNNIFLSMACNYQITRRHKLDDITLRSHYCQKTEFYTIKTL